MIVLCCICNILIDFFKYYMKYDKYFVIIMSKLRFILLILVLYDKIILFIVYNFLGLYWM